MNRKKTVSQKKQRSNGWLFQHPTSRRRRPDFREKDFAGAQDFLPENKDMDWIRNSSAYRMQIREQESSFQAHLEI